MTDTPPTVERYSEFGVSVRDVLQLVDTLSIAIGEWQPDAQGRDVRFDQHGKEVRKGTIYITEAQVREWIVDVASRLKTRITAFYRIREHTSLYGRIAAAGHDLVANGAASYVYAAAAPEKAGQVDTTSYAEVLWRRFLTGLEELEAAVAVWIRENPDDLEPEPGLANRLPGSGRFPKPFFRDGMQW